MKIYKKLKENHSELNTAQLAIFVKMEEYMLARSELDSMLGTAEQIAERKVLRKYYKTKLQVIDEIADEILKIEIWEKENNPYIFKPFSTEILNRTPRSLDLSEQFKKQGRNNG